MDSLDKAFDAWRRNRLADYNKIHWWFGERLSEEPRAKEEIEAALVVAFSAGFKAGAEDALQKPVDRPTPDREFALRVKMLVEQSANAFGNAENALREIRETVREQLGIPVNG